MNLTKNRFVLEDREKMTITLKEERYEINICTRISRY